MMTLISVDIAQYEIFHAIPYLFGYKMGVSPLQNDYK